MLDRYERWMCKIGQSAFNGSCGISSRQVFVNAIMQPSGRVIHSRFVVGCLCFHWCIWREEVSSCSKVKYTMVYCCLNFFIQYSVSNIFCAVVVYEGFVIKIIINMSEHFGHCILLLGSTFLCPSTSSSQGWRGCLDWQGRIVLCDPWILVLGKSICSGYRRIMILLAHIPWAVVALVISIVSATETIVPVELFWLDWGHDIVAFQIQIFHHIFYRCHFVLCQCPCPCPPCDTPNPQPPLVIWCQL